LNHKRFDGIGAHSKDGYAQLVECLFGVTNSTFYVQPGVLALERKRREALAGEVLRASSWLVGFERKRALVLLGWDIPVRCGSITDSERMGWEDPKSDGQPRRKSSG